MPRSLAVLPLIAAAAACGGSAPAAPQGPAAPVTAAPVAGPAPVTCGDAGVLLRGAVDDQKQAAPAKEAAIARTCALEKWPAEMLTCLGSQAPAKDCLVKLSPAQRGEYNTALSKWNEAFPEESLDLEGEGDTEYGGGDEYIDCGQAITNVERYAPALAQTGDERALVVQQRTAAIEEQCEDWDTEHRACFRDATSAADIVTCRGALPPAYSRALADKLAELERLATKVEAAMKAPATIGCKQVAAAYYADAKWVGRMDSMTGADRTRAIAESRAKMTKACTDDKWIPWFRACLVSDGGDACFVRVGRAQWGYPPIGIKVKLGVPECDAYGEKLKLVDACAALPQATRDSVRRSWESLSASWSNLPAASRAGFSTMCKHLEEQIRRSVTGAGCKY